MQIYNIAYALKIRVSDVMQMTVNEFMHWVAYFEIASEGS